MNDMKKIKVKGIIFIFTSFCLAMVGILMLIEKIQICSMNINLKNGVNFYCDSKESYDEEYDIAQLLPMMNLDDDEYCNEDDILVCYSGISTAETDSKYMALSDDSRSRGEAKYIAQIDLDENEEELDNKKIKSSKFASNYIVEEDNEALDENEEDKNESEPTKNTNNIVAVANSNNTVTPVKKTRYKNNYNPVRRWRQHKLYKVGDKVTYNGKTYSCVQGHDSLSTWEPNMTPALWKKIS